MSQECAKGFLDALAFLSRRKITGETPEVRSDKRKKEREREQEKTRERKN